MTVLTERQQFGIFAVLCSVVVLVIALIRRRFQWPRFQVSFDEQPVLFTAAAIGVALVGLCFAVVYLT